MTSPDPRGSGCGVMLQRGAAMLSDETLAEIAWDSTPSTRPFSALEPEEQQVWITAAGEVATTVRAECAEQHAAEVARVQDGLRQEIVNWLTSLATAEKEKGYKVTQAVLFEVANLIQSQITPQPGTAGG